MIKKVWAKFDGLDLKCVCDEHHRKCEPVNDCREYVVKFIEIERSEVADAARHLEKETKNLQRTIKNFENQISKSIKKFRI